MPTATKEVPYGTLMKILMLLPKERLAQLLLERAGIAAEWTDGETDALVLHRWLKHETDHRGRQACRKLAQATEPQA